MFKLYLVFFLFLICETSFAKCFLDSAPCKGCGCRGGPGYRHVESGKCVGFKNIDKLCGNPPNSNCFFENKEGSGANKQCALESKAKKSE